MNAMEQNAVQSMLEQLRSERDELRAQVAELVDVMRVYMWLVREEGNIRYEATTKAVYDKLRAAIAAVERGGK